MEEIKLICKACGEETTRLPKPAPQNAREGKQSLFHCPYCKAVNLRDGTIRTRKLLGIQKVPEEKKEGSSGRKVLGTIYLGILTIVTFIFLRKFLKGQGSGPGNNLGDPGQTDKLPWNSIR